MHIGMSQDLYECLGVWPDASLEQIRRAYREKARACHPDKTGAADTQDFCDLQTAYETLADPQARQKYDSVRLMRNAFTSFLYQHEVHLTLEEMFRGGTHVAPGGGVYTIPCGVEEGLLHSNMQMPLRVKQIKHDVFTREGGTLHMMLPLSLKDALLGTQRIIKTIDGQLLQLQVPCNPSKLCVQGGGMPVRGRSHADARRGDMMVHCTVDFPTLSEEQKQALAQVL